MNPNRAQRIWNTLSSKWINASPYGPSPSSRRNRRIGRKVRKGLLTNLIPVELVNAITGEVSKGYMRDISKRRLRQWLGFHNQRAVVEQVYVSDKTTFFHMTELELKEYPVLIKLSPTFQVPYLIDRAFPSIVLRGRQTTNFNLRTVDNLKYLETLAAKKNDVMKLFNKIKKAKKK